MENMTITNKISTNFKKSRNILKQFVPVTELRRNMNSVLDKLDEAKSIFIVKGSSVVGVMIKTEEFNDINAYIEQLEDELSILRTKQEQEYLSESEFESKYRK